jgi:hypothetical protein
MTDTTSPADELGPLPAYGIREAYQGVITHWYTADQMRAYALQERARLHLILYDLVKAVEWSEGKRPHNLTTLGRAWWRAMRYLGA